MSSYDDLIPGTSPSRRRSAYDDLLPGGAPAAAVQPAEDARLAGDEAATMSRVSAAAREALPSMWGEMQPEEPMPAPEVTDAADNLYQRPGAGWGEVLRAIIPGAGAQIRSAVANLKRMSNEERIQGREMALEPPSDPNSPQEVAYGPILRKARERQSTRLAQEIAARQGIEADAAAATQDMAAVTPKDMSTPQQAVFSAGTSAPTTLAGLAAGIVTRNPGIGMLIAGGGGSTVQAGHTYGEALEKGADHRSASLAATGDALIEGFDALPVGVALKPGSAFVKRLTATIAAESLTEGGQQMLQDFRAMAMEDPEKSLGEVWQNFKVAMLAGGIGGSVYGSIGGAANAGRKEAAPMHSEEPVATPAPAEAPAPIEQPAPAVAAPAKPASPYADLVPAEAVAPAVVARVTDESAATEARYNADEQRHTAFVDALNARQTAKIEAAKARAPEVQPGAEPTELAPQEIEALSEDELRWRAFDSERRKTALAESRGDGLLGGTAQALRDAVESIAFRTKGFSGLDIPSQAAVLKAVRRAIDDDKVLDAVVASIPVDVMNVLRAEKLSPEMLFHDDAMLFKALTSGRIGASHVSPLAMSGAIRAVANATAKTSSRAQELAGTPNDVGTALSAVNYGNHAPIVEQTAERKRAADLELDDFTLTGSERTADTPGQGGLSLGMPAHVIPAGTIPAAAGATPPARAKATVGKESARPDAIRAAMRELFGAPINEKNLSKKYLGIYRIKPQTVRLQNRNDLRTASHEIGHHISNLNKPFRKVMRAHQDELVKIAPRAYIAQAIKKYGSLQAALAHGDTRRLLIEEGFAEFIAEYLTAPATIQAKVPSFYGEFETWLGQNPRYAAALQRVADMLGAHESLSPEDKILAKVGMFKPPFGQRVASVVSSDTWDTFAQATLDKWHPLKMMVEDLAPGLAASKNPYTAARLLAGDAAIIEDWIGNFTSPFAYAKRLDPKNYGKPLKEILEPVLQKGETEINKFKAYLIARRAAELKKAGKENLFNVDEIRSGLALDTPLFRQVATEVYAYNDRLVDYAVEGGLLSPEVAEKFKQYANYIPFFREPEGEAKGGGRGDPFKRLTGGTANVRDPIANLIQNTANIIHATNRNAMVTKAVELAKAVPGGGRWIETVKAPQQAHSIGTQRILDQLKDQGVQIDTSMAEDMAAMQTFFTPSGKGDERTRTIVYKDGGELKAAQINDPILWKALGNIPPLQMGLITKMLAFPAQTLRAGVVLDPTFMVRNFMRDTLSATVQSKGAFIPVVSTAQGIKMMAQNRDAYRLWRAFGGAFADQFRYAEESAAIIEKMAKRGGFPASSIITPTMWLDALKRAGSYTEAGSRVGEFDATYKPGDIDSALQAALNAREVSTDFGMRGGSDAIQVLTRITPFMNPAMQGLYKTARVLSIGDGKAAAAKAAILGTNMALLSMALALLNSDEDWYQEIEEWEKTTYWHFKVGDQVYRIPKPFEYGTLFASMPEAIALRAAGKEGWEDFKKRMLQALGFVFGFRVIPQVVSIVGEPWANKSLFTGRKLVPDRQRNLEPGLQAHPYSSKVAQVAGEAANVSPAVIDNVVRNVFGTMGVHASTVADLMLEQTGAFPPGRERGWQTWPAIKAFVRDPDSPNSKQMRDFYEALEEYRKAVQSVKEMRNRGEDVKAERYAQDKSNEISMAKSAEAAARRMARLRRAVRSIEWSRDMTSAEKREEVRASNEEMQAIAAEQTRLYQQAKKSYAPAANREAQ